MLQPEQLAQDDDAFYGRIVTSEHLILQAYESTSDEKILYLLLDGSGSMDEKMSDGVERHVWARAVVIRLLAEAVRGGTSYLLRLFDEEPKALQQATNSEEADKLIRKIVSSGFTSGGTNILKALRKAVSDIRTKQGQFSLAEIVLITDGEDGAITEGELLKLLGSDIRLHLILIGRRSPALEGVASSRKFY